MVMHAFLSTLEVRQVDLFEFQNSQSHIVRQCLKLKKKQNTKQKTKTKPKATLRALSPHQRPHLQTTAHTGLCDPETQEPTQRGYLADSLDEVERSQIKQSPGVLQWLRVCTSRLLIFPEHLETSF